MGPGPADRLEGVGGAEPFPEQRPEDAHDLVLGEPGAAQEIPDEGGARELQMAQHVLRRGIQVGIRASGRPEPPEILAERHSHPSRCSRSERGPDHLAREPKGVEIAGLVAIEPRREQLLLPEAQRKVLALELPQHAQEPAGACEASLRMDMLPPQEEGAELLGRGHLRCAPSRHCRPLAQLIVHGDVAVLDARSAGKESPCRDDSLGQEGVERRLKHLAAHPVPGGDPRPRHRRAVSQAAAQDLLEPTRLK